MKKMGMASEMIDVGFPMYCPDPLADQFGKFEGRMWV
jgi:hypothetical protein